MALTRTKKRTEFKELREKAGLTLPEATELLKVDRRTTYRYERGETKPTRLALDTLRQAAESRLSKMASPAGFRFIDLFAGIGGLRIGFESVGGRCVFTSEWDLKCQETYAQNFPDNHPIAGDIREFSSNPEKIPAHDVLVAGFSSNRSRDDPHW
jgi:DNA (cytosine-5)-methyltransferase 1